MTLIACAAVASSLKDVIEQKIFVRDKMLSVINMQIVLSFWKIVFLITSSPFYFYIPVSPETCSSGVLEFYRDAWSEMNSNAEVRILAILGASALALGNLLAIWIVKY